MGFETTGLGENKVMITNVNQAPSSGWVTGETLDIMARGVNWKTAYENIQVQDQKQFPTSNYYGFFLIKIDWGGLNCSVHQVPFQDGDYSLTCLPSDMFSDGGTNLYAALFNVSGGFVKFKKCGFKNTSTGVWTDRMTSDLYMFSIYTCTRFPNNFD